MIAATGESWYTTVVLALLAIILLARQWQRAGDDSLAAAEEAALTALERQEDGADPTAGDPPNATAAGIH